METKMTNAVVCYPLKNSWKVKLPIRLNF